MDSNEPRKDIMAGGYSMGPGQQQAQQQQQQQQQQHLLRTLYKKHICILPK